MKQWRGAVAAMTLILVVAGCSSDEEVGGAGDLPSALSGDVVFVEASDDVAQAPDFSVELIDGTPIDASSLWADRPVVLVFTASWCERCADLYREVAGIVDEHDGAIALLGLVDEGDEGAADYAKDLGVRYPLAVVPTRVWDSYAAEEPPLVALVGPGGSLLRGWPGGVRSEVLAERLDELYSGTGDQDG